jgi:aminopeptidase-like protein
MDSNVEKMMYGWASDLFPINRSITGNGLSQTLNYISSILPSLVIHNVATGTRAFDWTIPNEWTINDAFIADMAGKKLISISENNLHVVGYSAPVNKIVSKHELESVLHSLPSQPNAIPYVTSYYRENYGFCLTENQRRDLGDGPFQIFIDSQLSPGVMKYGEIFLPGDTCDEILFSTYVCHPSMANDNLSGIVLTMALAEEISKLHSTKYSYRFLFLPETIGSIYYISKHLEEMKKNIVSGWTITCVGDENAYSFLPSRHGNTFADKVSRQVLIDSEVNYKEYTWLDRGSDERQYCSPGVDLPVASLMRSKYDTFPEYHTSLDNLDYISEKGLGGSLKLFQDVINILETNRVWKLDNLCEPQLGKRGLYPSLSTLDTSVQIRDLMNVISYLDGNMDLLTISSKCNLKYGEVVNIIRKLIESKLLF